MKPNINWLFLSIIIFCPFFGHSADLQVHISGLADNQGDVHIALYNKDSIFPSSHRVYRQHQALISERQTLSVFKQLQPGYYAIATYHDQNNNDKFDQNFFGIPLEDFGFSNHASALFGPPNFEDAKFLIKDTDLTIKINLNP